MTLVGQVARTAVQYVGVVVVARLLTPADYGLVAMVAALVGLGELVRDLGLSSAAVQAPTLSKAQRDNLFWINTLLGVVLAAGLAAASGVIADFYGEPALIDLTRVLALTLVLSGITAQFRASLARDLRFVASVSVELLAAVVGVSVGITMAATGWGFWALAGQELSRGLVMCAGCVIAARWIPGRPRRQTPMRSLISYGAHLLATNVLVYASRNADTVTVGYRFGSTATGLYNRAFQLMALPLTQISYPASKVALPVLSRLDTDRERYRRFLLRGQSILLHLVLPAFVLAAVLGRSIIVIVLGDDWVEAAPILRILALGGVFEAAAFATGWVFLSTGATKAQFRFALVSRPAMIAAVVLGSASGVAGVAAGYAVAVALIWPAGCWWASRHTSAPMRDVFVGGGRLILAYGMCGLLSWLALIATGVHGTWASLGLGVTAFAAAIAIFAAVWGRFRHDLLEAWGSARLLRRRRGSVVEQEPGQLP